MQNDDETHRLLREMRDLMVEQRNKYMEYLQEAKQGTYEQWTFMGVVIFISVSLALWVARIVE